jgi:hypothetical protein
MLASDCNGGRNAWQAMDCLYFNGWFSFFGLVFVNACVGLVEKGKLELAVAVY